MKLIISADYHLRETLPRCRKDANWLLSQELILNSIADNANKYDASVCIVGDLFHTPQVPAKIIIMFLNFVSRVKNNVYLLAGNHELSWHSWANVDNCSFGVLNKIMQEQKTNLLSPESIGLWSNFNEDFTGNDKTGIRFLHRLVFPSEKDKPPKVDACTAEDVVNEFPNEKWIFTGDYHRAFHYKKQGRHLINPGCITRQASDAADYQPSVYFIDTETDEIKLIELPDDINMVTDEHIQQKNDREDRITAFVSLIKNSKGVSLDFADNIEKMIIASENLDDDTISMIRELMEEE